MTIALGYWKIRGLAQPIRLLLGFESQRSGLEWEDCFYEAGDETSGFDRTSWTSVKESVLGDYSFPNLPYLKDGTLVMTQSLAILRHLGRRFDLAGRTEEERIDIDVLEGTAMDLKNSFTRLCYSADFERLKDGYINNLPSTLDRFVHKLGSKSYFAADGSRLTYVDFLLYETFDCLRNFAPQVMEKYPSLLAYCTRVEHIPEVKAFMASGKFFRGPINNTMAAYK
jgi:glutathione S-transferase